eukprot:CAMPEP_0201484332 /NCGR_PEP_ID=MMETSP0151_2-20130828/8532_1 /ASSEMBLY_ACC=CAM_ASM_000257 /TAXON_ID=200890 /ORGANISM="Paramoeba atlantica, Strain 621/1 / CCAP 1560/9" /LENGTH=82 /DNA_ID=CAMNT_0047867961 /DNA_START=446 /DNA_END=694 /DNA_ORIENTATION=+
MREMRKEEEVSNNLHNLQLSGIENSDFEGLKELKEGKEREKRGEYRKREKEKELGKWKEKLKEGENDEQGERCLAEVKNQEG